MGVSRQLEMPSPEEGFDELYYVQIKDGAFAVEKWAGSE
jgi:hypothetical protein